MAVKKSSCAMKGGAVKAPPQNKAAKKACRGGKCAPAMKK